jgi:hypothetical protein
MIYLGVTFEKPAPTSDYNRTTIDFPWENNPRDRINVVIGHLPHPAVPKDDE